MLFRSGVGVCAWYMKILERNAFNENFIAAFSVYFNSALLTPVVTFLIFDEPHDCFSCLSKDPDRAYSIYQLSLEERIRRKMVAKFSTAQERKSISDQDFISELLARKDLRRNRNFTLNVSVDGLSTSQVNN